MAGSNDPRGRPNLERVDEMPPVYYDTRKQGWLISQGIRPEGPDDPRIGQPPRQKRHRSADEEEFIRLVEEAMRLYQMTWYPSGRNANLIYFPFMFIKPQTTWKLRNVSTGEKYAVQHATVDDTDQNFTGAVLLRHERVTSRGPIQSPFFAHEGSRDRATDRLVWEDEKGKIIEFHQADPNVLASELVALSDEADQDAGTPPSFPPTISVMLERQEPGSMGKAPFGEPKQLKPHIRETVEDPGDPINYALEIQGWWMDNLFQFDCFSPSAKEANRLVRWFKNFMVWCEGVFMLNGVQRILYWDRRSDRVTEKFRDRLAQRPIRYYARTEDFHIIRRRRITSLKLTIRTQGRPTTALLTGEDTGISAPVNGFDFWHDETGGWLGGSIGIEESILPYEF